MLLSVASDPGVRCQLEAVTRVCSADDRHLIRREELAVHLRKALPDTEVLDGPASRDPGAETTWGKKPSRIPARVAATRAASHIRACPSHAPQQAPTMSIAKAGDPPGICPAWFLAAKISSVPSEPNARFSLPLTTDGGGCPTRG